MMSGSLFAWIVFRTKREAHEPLFGKTVGGGSYIIDPTMGDAVRDDNSYPEEPEPAPIPTITAEQNARFLDMINSRRAAEGNPPLEHMPGQAPVDAGKDKYND